VAIAVVRRAKVAIAAVRSLYGSDTDSDRIVVMGGALPVLFLAITVLSGSASALV
jgi:hypothetical protein